MAVIPILALICLCWPVIRVERSTWPMQEIRQLAGIDITGWFQVVLILVVITGIVLVGRYLAQVYLQDHCPNRTEGDIYSHRPASWSLPLPF